MQNDTSTRITSARDLERYYPHLCHEIRADAAAAERRRLKALYHATQGEDGVQLTEQAAERHNAERRARAQ